MISPVWNVRSTIAEQESSRLWKKTSEILFIFYRLFSLLDSTTRGSLIQIPMPIKPGWASLDWIQILFQVKYWRESSRLLSWICKRREGAVWLQSLVWKEWSIWAFMFDTKREIWQMTSLCHYKWRYFKALCCEHNFRKCDKILLGAVSKEVSWSVVTFWWSQSLNSINTRGVPYFLWI